MPTCSICYEPYKSPISLPCGHIFCRECIFRTVDSTKSCSVQHFCPTCRSPYNVVTVDPGLVPPYLRPHILPPIRQVFFDTSPKPVSAAPALAGDLGRATAENTALRMSCGMWRRRAELHAAANTGLLGLARAAKDHSQRMRAERDTALNRCALLKRKLCELMPDLESQLAAEAKRARPAQQPLQLFPAQTHARESRPIQQQARTCLPAYLAKSKPAAAFYTNPADMTQSHFGPPLKRREADPGPVLPSPPVLSLCPEAAAPSPRTEAVTPSPKLEAAAVSPRLGAAAFSPRLETTTLGSNPDPWRSLPVPAPTF